MPDASVSFSRLFDIVRRLRAPDGCPWDREQTPETLRPSLIEEAWEAVSAIDARDDANLREELGDLFLIATMVAWMKEQEGSFTVRQTLEDISGKLVRRHPHVFGSSTASTSKEVLRQWDRIKAAEHAAAEEADRASAAADGEASASSAAAGGADRGAHPNPHSGASALDRVARSLPPLERSLRLQKKAAKTGFDWPGPAPVWDKIEEELRELKGAAAGTDNGKVEEEAGDVLFSVVNLLRLLRVDPGIALHSANAKFERRFREMEKKLAAEGVSASEVGMDRLDAAWNAVKAAERATSDGSRTAQDPAAGAEGGEGSDGVGGPQSASK